MGSEQETALWLPVLRDLTYQEIHAFIDGLYVGYVDGERDHKYSTEKHYWRGGYVFGNCALRRLKA